MKGSLAVPYDRSSVQTGIVHFGVGNFHRSHQAMYLDKLFRKGMSLEWGICGVGLMPYDVGIRDALKAQETMYTLVERFPDGRHEARTIGSIVDYLYAPDDPEAVLSKLADPRTRIVSLTITEGGYNVSDSTGRFDATNKAVMADVQAPHRPATVFGLVTEGLRRRREAGVAPFTVVSCDNLPGNGEVARDSFTAFADLVDPELASWMGDQVRFPNSMVDRITPVTTDADRTFVSDVLGVDDRWPVVSESFVQWVLEDDFDSGRPLLEHVGVQVVEDVRPYESMKLRLLNAGHQLIAYFGQLLGYTYAHEAAADPLLQAALRRYFDTEGEPTLDPVPGVDLDLYKASLVDRFASPHTLDTLARLGTDSSDRMAKFLVPVILERLDAGARVPIAAAVVASWARFAEVAVTEHASFRLIDRREDEVRTAVEQSQSDPVGFLRGRDPFRELAERPLFTADYVSSLAILREHGAQVLLERIADGL